MSDPLWTAREVASATGGLADGDFSATGITFDSREVQPGDLFVALQGVRDGHEFVQGAFASGAVGALVSQPVSGGPFVLVSETLKALEALGGQARDRAPQVRRGAVTGSVGKTSVTQAIRAGLDLAGPAHGSVKSFNNHIGVPLTLARMPRDVERAVFEIGMNHANEIGPLSRMVQPHAVCVTTVGPVHIENFPDGEEGVARAKAEIFEGLGPAGVAVLNGDDRWFDLLKQAALERGARVAMFGSNPGGDAVLLDFRPDPEGADVRARIWGEEVSYRLAQPGFHWGPNSLATLLMLEALDVPMATALEALAEFRPLAGRGAAKRVEIPGGAFLLIDESYNANPISMKAGFRSLGARTDVMGRRIVALTDMLELGDHSEALHAGLADVLVEAEIDLVFTAGKAMQSLDRALPAEKRGGWAEDATALAPIVTAAVRPGDVVMVKGSNGSKASLVAKALAEMEAAREV
ncbi:UDP-N-acetylmuramoyl-tripeptide--D-alanyl-D-alanine ligase [Brevundimonas aveniformis]|uniref:UDP-N-acetylmuramoyl-tripeptide--D-alanyl-D- alanine ligase n=1 Tax=Brevundimonas aveniformis TaxID=370977 RepID=UPI002491E299|nr:UDP-N-acetylmuramoyl-tripeptide--D-alanyl-D-alanine ligase [Brevundimonas aveniformis]